jgi:hypothetical protein
VSEMTRAEKEAVAAQMYPADVAAFRALWGCPPCFERYVEFVVTLTDDQVAHFSERLRAVATLAPHRIRELWKVAGAAL